MSNSSSPVTDSIGHIESRFYNASVSYVERNVSITNTARVALEDFITLDIYGNETIGTFNYTIPTVFDKYVVSAEFFALSASTMTGILADSNIKPATKFVGEAVTTYTFPIDTNGTRANSTKPVQIYTLLQASNLITFDGVDNYQISEFVSPIRPFFPNLKVKNSLVAMRIGSKNDVFVPEEMNEIQNSQGNALPKPVDAKTLEWNNLTSSAYDPLIGLVKDFDYTTVHIKSTTPGAEEGQPNTISSFYFPKAERTLTIDPWGFVYVTETMTMQSNGAPRMENPTAIDLAHGIYGFKMQLNKFSKILKVYDNEGRLNGEAYTKDGYPISDPKNNYNFFEVEFRNAIYGGEKYTFTVEYMMNASNVISVDSSVYALNTTLFSSFNSTVSNLKTVYQLPAGSELLDSTFRSISTNSLVDISTKKVRGTLSYFEHVELQINIQDASYIDNNQFQIKYKYNGLGHLQYILSFIMTFIALLAIFYLSTNINFKESKTLELEKEKIPIAEIETFVRLFTELNDGNNRIADITEKRRKNKLSQKEYTGQVKAIRKRIRDESTALDNAVKVLNSKGSKYERLVSKIMISNQKISDIRSNMNNARRQYSKKEINKNIYQKMMRTYRLDTDKHDSIINRTLSELRDILQ